MTELAAYFVDQVRGAVSAFCDDIDALTHEQLDRSYNEKTRRAYDYIFEVAVVNLRVAARLRGEDPGPMPWDFGVNWLGAPKEYRDKEAVLAYTREAGDELITAAQEYMGDERELIEKLVFIRVHISYHDGQLNYIQSLDGDLAVHWKS